MPRADRYLLPSFLWHFTHRCHKKWFPLKFELPWSDSYQSGSTDVGVIGPAGAYVMDIVVAIRAHYSGLI